LPAGSKTDTGETLVRKTMETAVLILNMVYSSSKVIVFSAFISAEIRTLFEKL